MHGRVLLGGVVGFALGILVVSFFDMPWASVGFMTLLGALFLFFRFWKKEAVYLVCGVFMLAAALGMARTALAPAMLPEPLRPAIGSEVQITGVIVADPDIREASQRLTIEVHAREETTRVLVVAPPYPAAAYGETIRAEGTLELPEPFDTNGGRVFRYDKFLAKDGVFAVMHNAHIEVTAPRSGAWMQVRGALSDGKSIGLDALAIALPEPQASLAGGLILGGKQGLGQNLLNDFITAGLVHIVVLSGYNVMIVADFIMQVFRFVAQGFAPAFGGVAIAAFVLMAGAGPASIRAGIMASIALYGRASGRRYDAFRALIAAGVLMLVWNPLTLAYDPGFQLSFVATLGLIFGAPITERWLAFVRIKFLREIASSTIAAQIAVLPLLLYQNGLFSVVALPANLLVLPMVPLAMLASALAGAAGLAAPALAPIVAFPAYVLLSYITGFVEFAAHLPFAAVALPAFPFALVVAAYALLAWFVTPHARRIASLRRPN